MGYWVIIPFLHILLSLDNSWFPSNRFLCRWNPYSNRNKKFIPKTNINTFSIFRVTVPSRGNWESTVLFIWLSGAIGDRRHSHWSMWLKCQDFLKLHWYRNYIHLAHLGYCKLPSINLNLKKKMYAWQAMTIRWNSRKCWWSGNHKGAMRYRTELAHKRTWVEVCLIHIPSIYNKDLVISLRVLEFLTLADLVQLPFPTHSVLKVFTFFQSNLSSIPSLTRKFRMSEWRDSVFKRFSYPIRNSIASLFLHRGCLAETPTGINLSGCSSPITKMLSCAGENHRIQRQMHCKFSVYSNDA